MTNSNMLREFAVLLITTHLFPSSTEKQYLTRQDFLTRMEESNHLFLKPHELRKRYTEFVI
jgi:hypothetical protein